MEVRKPLLAVKNLSVGFEDGSDIIDAISNVNFDIYPGETFALLGESGCGKSLTALSIIQLLANNAFVSKESRITFNEQALLELSENEWRKRRGSDIAMIFQEPMTSLNPVLTIEYQLSEAIGNQEKLSNDALNLRLKELLTLVELGERSDLLAAYPHQLSGGQKQRMMIAMALAGRPNLLIADEPTTALDVTVEAQILQLLANLQSTLNMSILLITHDLSVVKRIAHRVGVMYAGEMVETAPIDLILNSPKHPYTKELLNCLPSIHKRGETLDVIHGVVPSLLAMPDGCRFKERCMRSFEKCSEHPKLLSKGNNHDVRCHANDSTMLRASSEKKRCQGVQENPVLHGKPCLSVRNLCVEYPIYQGIFRKQVGTLKAVNHISFDIKSGETVAVVGESGCGKTSLSKAIVGLVDYSHGCIEFLGKPVSENREQLQMIFQDPFSSMNPRMLVEDILLEGLKNKLKGQERTKEVLRLLDLVGLSQHSHHRYPHQFSGGQRQRLSIARALAMKPQLLICDEPTSALDVSIQAQILNLLKDLQVELGMAYLFISHDLHVVSYLSDRVYVMRQGQFVEEAETLTLFNTPLNDYTKRLLMAKSL